MKDTTPLQEATTGIVGAVEGVQQALKDFAENARQFGDVDVKRAPSRTDIRAQERAFVAAGYRENKARIAQDVANERGTLPDARELARIHKARKAVNEQLALAKAKAAHPSAKGAHDGAESLLFPQ